ncbi:hypothetical protein IC620_09045 [Hazenella sp. IB182357]|uniref:Uncharacterized protein n=1 Tax=Polycladospora coralii TaxID=2771432 RepID=A0A926N9U6_9BACL|nr:hypothetical protein [Polycladospora coralii]MBD1372502.1 hypothetical protein [Polycladospora coralii]
MKKLFLSSLVVTLVSLSVPMMSEAAGSVPNNIPSPETLNSSNNIMPTIILKEDGSIEFREAWHVPDQLLEDAFYMADKFTDAVDRETLELQFGEAIDIVKADGTLGLLGTMNQTINQDNADVDLMSEKLVELLANSLSVSLTPEQLEAYKQSMKSTFLNLSFVDTGYMQWKQSSASNVSYLYNLFFAVERGGKLLGMPVGLTISANASKVEYLNNASFTNYNYSVNVKAIKVMKFK